MRDWTYGPDLDGIFVLMNCAKPLGASVHAGALRAFALSLFNPRGYKHRWNNSGKLYLKIDSKLIWSGAEIIWVRCVNPGA